MCWHGQKATTKAAKSPLASSFGSISRGINVNVHDIRRALIAAVEMQQDRREDEIIARPGERAPAPHRPRDFRGPEVIA